MNFSDFSSPAFFDNPYPLYEQVRRAGALLPIGPNAYVTGRFKVIDALLRDRRMGKTYMQSVRVRYGESADQEPVFRALERTFLMMNPPSHTRLRTLLMKAFNTRQIDRIREVVDAVVDGLVARLAGKDEFDLVTEFALPLPVQIICRLLDIPVEDAQRLGEAASHLVSAFDLAPLNAAMLEKANHAALELEAYFQRVLTDRRARPGDDLITTLANVEAQGITLSEDEIVSNIVLLFIAGHETTANSIGNAMIALLRHPEQLARVAHDPSLVSGAVVESLRFDGAVQMLVRTSFEEILIDDITLAPGSMVFMLIGAANHDADAFDNPAAFDVSRQSGVPSLAFGGGIHYCLGARLATLEMESAIRALTTRFPALRASNLDRLKWHRRNNLRGVESLMVKAHT
jgi:cytochrome P450